MTDPARPSGSEADSIRARLEALDQLYADGAISATELSEGRRTILTGSDAAAAGADKAAEPAVHGHGETQRISAAGLRAGGSPASGSAGGGPEGPRLFGLPVWAAGVIGGLVALIVIVGIVALVSGGSDDDSSEEAKAAGSSAYVAAIKQPLGLLTRSAVLVGKELVAVSDPGDLAKVRRMATRQLDAIEESRTALADVDVPAEDARAHRILLRAVTGQRSYVVALLRASDATPSQASLNNVNRARQTAGKVLADYRSFFALEPEAADAITGTDLTDTFGLREAIRSAIDSEEAQREREAEAARRAAAPPVVVRPSNPGVPAGNPSAEADRIFREIQAGNFSSRAAADALYYSLSGTSDPLRGNAAFNAGVIRYANGDCSGAIEAFGYAASVSGNSLQNDIRSYAYNQALAGCGAPVYALIE